MNVSNSMGSPLHTQDFLLTVKEHCEIVIRISFLPDSHHSETTLTCKKSFFLAFKKCYVLLSTDFILGSLQNSFGTVKILQSNNPKTTHSPHIILYDVNRLLVTSQQPCLTYPSAKTAFKLSGRICHFPALPLGDEDIRYKQKAERLEEVSDPLADIIKVDSLWKP